MKKIFSIFTIAIALSGCTTTPKITGYYNSNVDPDANISTTSSFIVEPYSKGDLLTNKRYLKPIISTLKAAGYTNVATSMPSKPDFYLIFDYRIETKIESEDVPIYGTKNTGKQTSCTSSSYGSNAYTNCQTYNQTKRTITGYTPVQKKVEERVFQITVVNPENTMVYNSISYTRGDSCSKWKMFDFLTEHAIKNIDFKNPVELTRTIEMPDDYSCK